MTSALVGKVLGNRRGLSAKAESTGSLPPLLNLSEGHAATTFASRSFRARFSSRKAVPRRARAQLTSQRTSGAKVRSGMV
jgi:hypothetical protein